MTSSSTTPTTSTSRSGAEGLLPDPDVLHYAAFPDDDGAGGNPAGVVLAADGLDDAARLAVAAAVGYSETAFVDARSADGSYRVRFFSRLDEVTFCGHATIAAAVALAERHGTGELLFHTQAGPVAVSTGRGVDGPRATLTSVPSGTRPATARELATALAALRWEEQDLDPRYPSHVAHAGAQHLVLVVRERSRLADLAYDFDALAGLMAERDWTTLQLVHPESPVLYHARDPFPPGGVVEDPATGAAAAAFGGYLRALGLVDVPATVTILQGQDMGRPSRLTVHIPADSDRVMVTGRATVIAPAGLRP